MAAVQFHSPSSVTHYFAMQVNGAWEEFRLTWRLAQTPAQLRQGCLTPAEASEWSLTQARILAEQAGASMLHWLNTRDEAIASVLLTEESN
jgi:hypothetical protein